MMKKIIFVFILLLSYVSNQTVKSTIKFKERPDDWSYVYSFAILTNPEEKAIKIADLIYNNCTEKGLDTKIVTRKFWNETKLKQYKVSYLTKIKYRTNITIKKNVTNITITTKTNKIPCAYGIGQVNKFHWEYLFYYVVDKKYAKMLHENPDKIYDVIFYLDANIDASTTILRTYLDDYKTYDRALTAYWAGPGSDEFSDLKRGIRNKYINSILNEKEFEKEMKKYNGWVKID